MMAKIFKQFWACECGCPNDSKYHKQLHSEVLSFKMVLQGPRKQLGADYFKL